MPDNENTDEQTHQQSNATMKDNITNKISTSMFFYLGAVVFFIGLLFGGSNLNEEPSVFGTLSTVIACALIATGGVLIIVRREAPRIGTTPIKGIGAILVGLLVLLTFGCGGIGILVSIITEMVGR